MYKTQKTFSPLECSLCNRCDCKYRTHYEQLYSCGFKISVTDCKRLNKQKQQNKIILR